VAIHPVRGCCVEVVVLRRSACEAEVKPICRAPQACMYGKPPVEQISRVGQDHIYTVYMRYFGLEITKYTVYIYDICVYVYIQGSGQPYR
jgi:hypothetical protein